MNRRPPPCYASANRTRDVEACRNATACQGPADGANSLSTRAGTHAQALPKHGSMSTVHFERKLFPAIDAAPPNGRHERPPSPVEHRATSPYTSPQGSPSFDNRWTVHEPPPDPRSTSIRRPGRSGRNSDQERFNTQGHESGTGISDNGGVVIAGGRALDSLARYLPNLAAFPAPGPQVELLGVADRCRGCGRVLGVEAY